LRKLNPWLKKLSKVQNCEFFSLKLIHLLNQFIMKARLSVITGMALIAMMIVSCSTDEESSLLYDETSFAENLFAQLTADVDEVVYISGSASGRFGLGHFGGYGPMGCVTRTVETPEDADYPKTITIVFDDECESHGVVKSGTIIITLTGPPREEGSQRVVTFENFFVNGNQVSGTRTHTCLGNGNFTMILEDGMIITEDGKVIIREATRTRECIAGCDTWDPTDDVYQITGSASGETSDGEVYSKEIIEPLIKQWDCPWIVSGIIETTIGETVITLDFGDGTCDNLAIRTVDGESEEIEMDGRIRKYWRKKHHHGMPE
jgi:hypothetical protein